MDGINQHELDAALADMKQSLVKDLLHALQPSAHDHPHDNVIAAHKHKLSPLSRLPAAGEQ